MDDVLHEDGAASNSEKEKQLNEKYMTLQASLDCSNPYSES